MRGPFNTAAEATARMLEGWGIDYVQDKGALVVEGGLPYGPDSKAKIREIAQKVFGDPGAVIKLNMAEYQEKHDIAKLIGAPPGYVGFEQGGTVTNELRKRPNTVLLLDECEKASPAIMEFLSDAIAEGVITDNQGKKTSLDNTVVLKVSDHISDATLARRAAQRQAEENAAAVERMVVHATVLQTPLSVGRPLSFRAKFQMA